jgi:hypothetical protein
LPIVSVYVENDAGMAADNSSAAWAFDPEFWGRCGQGDDEALALLDLRRILGRDAQLAVAERVHGDEQAFNRDRVPCTQDERQATLSILAAIRPQTIALVEACSDAELDWDDPERVLPSYAGWRTLRQIAWHIADTESRYYLPCLELGYRERAHELLAELELSADHVRKVVESMPGALVVEGEQGAWTTVKVLRRLAWHERSELTVMQAMLMKARTGS